MTQHKKEKPKPDRNVDRPIKSGHKGGGNVSGAPGSSGGSRQGNVGHQDNTNSDNAHR